MKTFKAPVVQIIRFDRMDIITASQCACDACTVCPEGKNDCRCYDFSGLYDTTNEGGRNGVQMIGV